MDDDLRPARSLLAHLDTRAWLERWSREAIEAADELNFEVTDQMRTTGWIGSPPASAAQIDAAEAKLGRALPPSLRDFYALTNGWPVLSMDYETLLPVGDLGWVRDLKPQLVGAWAENDPDEELWEEGAHDGPPLLRRSLLLNTGTDYFLLDPLRLTESSTPGRPEWATVEFTNWNPGADDGEWSFRAGLEAHYASFVQFDCPESLTHQEVAGQVEQAYRSLLTGDLSHEDVLGAALSFGSARAQILHTQARILGHDDDFISEISNFDLDLPEIAQDPAVLDDLLPLFVHGCLGVEDGNEQGELETMIERWPGPFAERLRKLAATHRRERGLTADFSYVPAFAAIVDEARALAAQRWDKDAFALLLGGLGQWTPLSGGHLAPMGLLWDRELARVMTPERRRVLLESARGGLDPRLN